jgi:hypothetical protein
VIDTSVQDAEYRAWTHWHPESPPGKRDIHCHGFDAGVGFALGAARQALAAAEDFILAASTRPDDLAAERAEVLGEIRRGVCLSEGAPRC